MKIYKYTLAMLLSQTISIPSPQKFLSVQNQHGKLCVWYEVNETHDQEDTDDIEFIIAGTGDTAPGGFDGEAKYLGTVQQGSFVWHIYARCAHAK